MDNHNAHIRKCFEEVLRFNNEHRLTLHLFFYGTPKYSSWSKLAPIEIDVLDLQCLLKRRVPNHDTILAKTDAWQRPRIAEQRNIAWSFPRQDADVKVGRHYIF
jgi:hypothetical protein